MVLCNIILKLKRSRNRKSTRMNFDVDKILNEKTKSIFQKEIAVKLTNINIQNQTTNSSYNEIADILNKAAEKVLVKVRTKKHSWMTNELLDLCDERRRFKSIKNISTVYDQEYKKINSKLKRGMRDTKEKWIQSECLSIDENIRNGIHSKQAYQTLKALTKSNTTKQNRVIENNKQAKLSQRILK